MYNRDELLFAPIEDMLKEMADVIENLNNLIEHRDNHPPLVIEGAFRYAITVLIAVDKRFKEMNDDVERLRKQLKILKDLPFKGNKS